ncbi:MAG: Fur family transcriptional regulator [Nitrospinota bacterium]
MDKETLYDLCKTKKTRLTPQRWQVYKTLTEMTGHPSVEDIHCEVVKILPSISLNTVYKALDWMEKNRFAMSVPIRESKKKYCPNQKPHSHIICAVCGDISDSDKTGMAGLLPDSLIKNYHVLGLNVTVNIICDRCLRAGNRKVEIH